MTPAGPEDGSSAAAEWRDVNSKGACLNDWRWQQQRWLVGKGTRGLQRWQQDWLAQPACSRLVHRNGALTAVADEQHLVVMGLQSSSQIDNISSGVGTLWLEGSRMNPLRDGSGSSD